MKKIATIAGSVLLSGSVFAYDVPVTIDQTNVTNSYLVVQHFPDLEETNCRDRSVSVVSFKRDNFDGLLVKNSGAERDAQFMAETVRKNAAVTALLNAKSDGSLVRLRTAGCTSNGRSIIRGVFSHQTP